MTGEGIPKHSYSDLRQMLEESRQTVVKQEKIIQDIVNRAVDPPLVLTERGEEIRKRCNEDMRKEFKHLFWGLYWK